MMARIQMKVTVHHRFALEFRSLEDQCLDQVPLEPRWEPAFEWLAFAALRAGKLAAPGLEVKWHAVVNPVVDSALGLPYCRGIRMSLVNGEGPVVSEEFPFSFFAEDARSGSAPLVERGLLKSGELFRYKLVSYPSSGTPSPAASAPGGMEIEEVESPAVLGTQRLARLLEGSRLFGKAEPGDYPVFIPHSVLEQCAALAEGSPASETGGVLIGHLHRDPASQDIALEVTAQIPVRHAEHKATTLTFTENTWAAARDAIRLRGRGETMLSWWHSHPARAWCNPKCGPEERKRCPLMRDYLSTEDLTLHAAVFPRAYSVALLVTLTDDGPRPALFGWRLGVVQPRAFHILDPSDSSRFVKLPETEIPQPDTAHETPNACD